MEAIFKRVLSVAIIMAVTIAATCGGVRIQRVSPQTRVARAAESQGKYIQSVRISYASTRDEAQKEFGSEYTVLDYDFNNGMSSHSWIGYTTTDNPEDAIRDIKIEEMSGKHSTSDYEELLKNQREAVNNQIDTLIPVIAEFSKNVESEQLPAAIEVKNALNYYIEDDTGLKFGDFFVEMGKTLRTDASNADVRKKLEVVFVEGNNTVIQLAERLLTQGLGSKVGKKGSWLTRMSEIGPEGLYDIYKQVYPALRTKAAIKKQLAKDYGVDAESIRQDLSTVQDIFKEAQASDIGKAMESGDSKATEQIMVGTSEQKLGDEPTDDSTIDEMFDSLVDTTDVTADTIDAVSDYSTEALILTLKDTPYGEQTMYDFFTKDDMQASDLYVMAYVLTDAQKNIMSEIGLYNLFEGILAEYVGQAEDVEPISESLEEGMYSVYEGVDRDVFKGDTAITEDTLKRMATSDSSFLGSITGDDPIVNGLLAMFSIAIGGVMIGGFVHEMGLTTTNKTVATVLETKFVKNPMVEQLGKEIEVMTTQRTAVQLKYIEEMKWIEGFKAEITGVHPVQLESKLEDALGAIAKNTENYSDRMVRIRKVLGMDNALRRNVLNFEEGKLSRMIDEQYVKVSKTATVTQKVKLVRWGPRILYLVGAVAALAFAAYEIYCIAKPKKGVEFTEIPAKMISRTYPEGETEVNEMTYTVVTTMDGKKADIHNWKGQQWQAIYVTYDINAGDPVLANTFTNTFGSTSNPDDVPVSEFCYNGACDLGKKAVTGTGTDSVYLYFRTGEDAAEEEEASAEITESTEASVFGGPSLIWIIVLIVVVLGAGTGVIVYTRKKRKRDS